MTDIAFTRLAGWAAMVTVLTTIGVHYVSFPAETFEQRLALATNGWYIAHRWMIILHCILVIASMLGIAMITFQQAKGLTILGMAGYMVFGFTEIGRMFSVLEYLNPLRLEYLAATDEAMRTMLKYSLDHFQLTGFALFAVFAFAFTLGNACFGWILKSQTGVAKWIGFGFLYWSGMGVLGMMNEGLHWKAIESWNEFHAKGFQPVFRGIIGWWMLQTGAVHLKKLTETQKVLSATADG